MGKFNLIKLATVGGMVLSIIGTIASGWANQQNTKKIIEEQVKAQVDQIIKE